MDRAIQLQDTPDAAKRPATTRTVLTAQVHQGDPISFLDKLNHDFHYEYLLKGHRLIHNDIIITLFQIFKVITFKQLTTAPYPTRTQRRHRRNRPIIKLDSPSSSQRRNHYRTIPRHTSTRTTKTTQSRLGSKYRLRVGNCR